ncbi:MAG TPA: peptidoglycan-binding protein [Solirubrobacteraceae bacterium]|nr:peptidoglycan-binding protein [Solirubrobacteraceae bacterium]
MAEPTLERGSKGDDVKDLQEGLIELDFKPGTPDGVFGVLTESAVRSFQTWAQVAPDGAVGPLTWEKFDDADKSDPTLRTGDERIAVRGLQRRLLDAGYGAGEIEIDGEFGPQTEAAVVAFQEASEIDVDGIVGPQTWEALNGLGSGD